MKAQPRTVKSLSQKIEIFGYTVKHPIFDYYHRFRYFLNNHPIVSKLWSRFFLLAVFATMYIRDLGTKRDFYGALGLNAREYDQFVINKTNETSARVFPVVLNVYDESFYERLDIIVENGTRLSEIDKKDNPNVIKVLFKLPIFISNGYQLIRLYLLKPLESDDFQPSIR